MKNQEENNNLCENLKNYIPEIDQVFYNWWDYSLTVFYKNKEDLLKIKIKIQEYLSGANLLNAIEKMTYYKI